MSILYRHKMMIAGAVLLLLMVALSLAEGYFSAYDLYALDPLNRLKAPTPQHWFGTDNFGRDVLVRVAYAVRISLLVGLAVAVAAGALGMIIGLLSAWYRPVDLIAMRICDGLFAFPSLLLAIQSQILNLLLELQRENGFAYLFIAHDLSVVHHIADRIGVMYRGRLVEEAPTETLFSAARHPYTQYLLASIPPSHPRLKTLARTAPAAEAGNVPAPGRGCVFSGTCPQAMANCFQQTPVDRIIGEQHHIACHLVS